MPEADDRPLAGRGRQPATVQRAVLREMVAAVWALWPLPAQSLGTALHPSVFYSLGPDRWVSLRALPGELELEWSTGGYAPTIQAWYDYADPAFPANAVARVVELVRPQPG